MNMEIAVGIDFNNGRFTGTAVNQDGILDALPLSDLYRRGLPTAVKPARRRIDTNFADWRPVEMDEYLEAFGFKVPTEVEICQQVFETESGNRRFVIPVLALMRALFRPTKHLLPTMFRPQALDQVCRLNSSADGLTIDVDAKWASNRVSTGHSDWNGLLGWMLAHPSANAMAGSVHHQALHGRIGMSLPSARALIVLRGLEVGRTMFVTDASVTTITPEDLPVFAIVGVEKVMVLHDRALQKGGNRPERAGRYTVPMRSDGTVELSDDEWLKIEPLIDKPRKRHVPFKLPQRDLLNGILDKLATGTAWQKVSYRTGNWLNASAAFQRWSKRGTLQLILTVLCKSRFAH
jgi:hypothetical protein